MSDESNDERARTSAGLRSALEALDMLPPGAPATGISPEALATLAGIAHIFFGDDLRVHERIAQTRKAIREGTRPDGEKNFAPFLRMYWGLIQWNRLALHSGKRLLGELDPERITTAAPDLANLLRSGALQGLLDELDSDVANGWFDSLDATDTDTGRLFFAVDSVHFVASGHAFVALRDVIAPRIIGDEATLEARNRLATSIGDAALGFQDEAIRPRLANGAPSDTEENGILFLDELFAQRLESIGENGKRAAADVRKKGKARTAETRWILWKNPSADDSLGAPWVAVLGRALWLDALGPLLDRERRNPPALVFPVHEDVARIHSRARRLEEVNGQRALVFDDRDPIIVTPAIADEAIAELVVRGVSLLGTVTAHKALRWEIHEGHARAARGIPDARTLRVDGGWSVFAADVLGMKKKSAAEDLRAIVHAQASVLLRLPAGGTAGMLTLRDMPQRGRTRGAIEIVLGTMLLPHYVHELGDLRGRNAGESKRLVPVVDLPPTVGRGNDHGQQATLSMLVVRELRKHARELAAEDSVAIDLDRWATLAREAGLPSTLLGRLLDRWTKDGDDGPAFLEEPSPGRYRLGRAHGAAQAFIVAAGTIETSASEGGRRAVEARERKRRRLGRGRG